MADRSAKQLTAEGGGTRIPWPRRDGGKIAWLVRRRIRGAAAVRKVCVMNADGSRAKVLSGSLDRDAGDPQWSSDSRTVYFVADDRGSTHVYAARNDGTVRQVTNAPERLWGFSLADNGRAVAVRSTPSEAGDVFTFTVDRVSQPAASRRRPTSTCWRSGRSARVEEMPYASAGKTVQAWLVKPPGFDAAKKYPLLLDIRDDPRAMYGVDFNLRAQILAARGFVVLCVNPRGTPGYGESFGNLLRTRNPGDDYDDLMRGVDSWSPKATSISSGSDGGRSAGGVGDRHTDRFRAAVVRRPVGDSAAAPWKIPSTDTPEGPSGQD